MEQFKKCTHIRADTDQGISMAVKFFFQRYYNGLQTCLGSNKCSYFTDVGVIERSIDFIQYKERCGLIAITKYKIHNDYIFTHVVDNIISIILI